MIHNLRFTDIDVLPCMFYSLSLLIDVGDNEHCNRQKRGHYEAPIKNGNRL